MKIGNLGGRLVLATDAGVLDVERCSGGRFGPAPGDIYERWDEFVAWARTAPAGDPEPWRPEDLGPPSPEPAQVFAIGINYRAHADEAGRAHPDEHPVVFTKFRSALTGPVTTVELPAGGSTDWEIELVVVIGRAGHRISEEDAWSHVAGLTVGQDLSERVRQRSGPVPQFSMGKSYPGFAPTGPWLVTPDEVPDRDDLTLSCWIDDELVQHGRTRDMIFSVPRLIEQLSAITPLVAGDIVFTGTPAGVGIGRTPPRFLRAGERLRSRIEGIGELEQVFTDPGAQVPEPR